MKNNQRYMEIAVGDIALIKGDNKHRGKWNIVIVEQLCEGKDNIIRAVKLRSKETYIEQPLHYLYPLELNCDTWKRQKTVCQCRKQPLNVNESVIKP